MRLARHLVSFAAAASILAITSVASADALPPDAEDCLKKSQGDTCMTAEGASGTCQPEQTSSASCVREAMEAGTDAQACEMPIEVCIAGAASDDAGTGGNDGGGSSGTDGGASGAKDGGASTTNGTNNSSSKSGCSTAGMSAGDVARAGAPFLIAAIVPLVLRRRKRNKDRA